MVPQYLYNSQAEIVGVFIPINEWNEIEKKLKMSILNGIELGLRQVNEFEKGTLKAINAKTLLKEL